MVAAAATDGADNELTKGGMQVLLESYIAYPLLYLLVPVSLVEFFHSYKKKYLIIAIALAILRVCIDARRTYLTSFITMVVMCIYLHRKDYKFYSYQLLERYRKFKKYAIWILLFFGYFFIYVSQQRSIAKSGEDQSSTLRTLTYYYGGSVQFFDDCVRSIKIDHTWGFSTFRGFLAPFWGVLKLFGIESPDVLENANRYLSELHAHIVSISPDKNYNSFATCFFQFYCDGGVIGIIILSFLYGYYGEYIFERMAIKKSRCAESAYVFFFANILMLSFVNMETVLALNFWPLILVNLFYKKNSKRSYCK
jgi:oligosaccharide repeat unit polymerase